MAVNVLKKKIKKVVLDYILPLHLILDAHN